ncbi:MAG: DUF3617 family protein [Candidatus Dechloromonas phosphoritropha]
MNTARISLTLLAVLLAAPASAADAPKRKSGLWEVRTEMAGMPSRGPIQMCVDQTSDNLMQERAREKSNCSVMDVSRGAGKVTIHSVCKFDGTTATTDAVITGDFDSTYRNDMLIRYNPPQHGMSEMKMTQEARWLGPCKPGQKPGDIMMPGMPPVNTGNMQEMMKHPQVREMMKRQQQGRQ